MANLIEKIFRKKTCVGFKLITEFSYKGSEWRQKESWKANEGFLIPLELIEERKKQFIKERRKEIEEDLHLLNSTWNFHFINFDPEKVDYFDLKAEPIFEWRKKG